VTLSDDLDLLNSSIRQLQVKWDMFFSGVEKRPPNEFQARVEKLIRQYAFAEIRNNTERFRYQTLTARFNTFNELWQKRLRAREEGKAFGVHGLKADVLPPPEPGAGTAGVPGGSPGEFRIGDPERDDAAVRALYDRFVEERQRTGENAPAFESFQKLIGKQTAKILGGKDDRAVQFRLETKDGKVALKAKVVK
jgi:hypothetical protein